MAGSAREVALVTLSACEKQGAWSDLALKKHIRDAGLDSRDAALATRLCFGVQQNRMLLDFYLSRFSTVKLERIEHGVLNALRLGVYQIAFLSKIPPSAAVNESVELARRYSRNPRSPGLVNGILRSVARNAEHLPVIEGKDPTTYLSIRYSHPLWLVQEFLAVLGPEGAEALLSSDNGKPPITAQVNTNRFTVERVATDLRAQGVESDPHAWRSGGPEIFSKGSFLYPGPGGTGGGISSGSGPRNASAGCLCCPGRKVLRLCYRYGG